MDRQVRKQVRSSKAKQGLRCGECGATAARNGNPFTKFALKVHRGRMHKARNAHGNPLSLVLTERQYEVMERIVAGRTQRAVAERMGLSFHTVSEHVRMSYRKLGVKNRVELVKKWLEKRK